jgi:hypothetical protein
MALLQSLPHCLSEPGPKEVDGVGNYIVQVFAAAPSNFPALTLYLLDSHGAIPGILGRLLRKFRHRYDHIKQSQIKWFMETSRKQHRRCEQTKNDNALWLSLAFFHIPLPEYKNCDSHIRTGSRREPTEGPFYNSHFYKALAKQDTAVIATGHDHLNNFVAQLPRRVGHHGQPNLCSGASAGFGAYGEYAKKRTYRQARCFEFDAKSRSLTTWMHVEHRSERVDELVLVENGVRIYPWDQIDRGSNFAVQ